MRKDMPMNQRMDRIGELLAEGVYLYVKRQREMEKGNVEKATWKRVANSAYLMLKYYCLA